MKNKKTIFIWSSDFENFTGEGILARSFVSRVFNTNNLKIIIKSNNSEYLFYKNKITRTRFTKYKNNFVNKYFKIFIGVYYLWKYNNLGYITFYINYLPLWNFLIFALLPKKTFLGPITGGKYIANIKNMNSIIRKYLFPLLYRLSIKIISKKYKFSFFSTKMLINYLPKNLIKRSLFDLTLICFDETIKKKNKDIEYLFYYRKHANKSNSFLKKIIENLIKRKTKIFIVGDFYKNKKVINLGNLRRQSLLKYLSRTKYSLNSGENFYSLFALDCMAANVNILVDKNNFPRENFFPKDKVNVVDYNNFEESYLNALENKNNKKKYNEKILFKKKYLLIKEIKKKLSIN